MCLVTGPLPGELRSPSGWDPEAPPLPPPPLAPRPARAAARLARPAGPSKGDLLRSHQFIRRITLLGSLARKPSPQGEMEEVPKCPVRSDAPTCGGGSRPCASVKVRAGRPWVVSSQPAEQRTLRSESAAPGASQFPPGGARRVRGLGLRDRGRLAVTAALGWPFPAL